MKKLLRYAAYGIVLVIAAVGGPEWMGATATVLILIEIGERA